MKTFNSFLKLALPLMLGLVCLTVQADNLTVYQKVKSTDDLVSGDKYIIVREDPEQSYAMGNLVKKSSGLVGESVKVSIQEDKITIPNSDVLVVTLNATSGAWYIAVDNKYLTASTSDNYFYLQTKDSNDKKQKWAITMESITNVGAAGRGIRFGTDFRSYYNNNNSHDEVCLYRQVTDAEGIMLTVGAISYATLYYSNQAFVVPTNVKVHTYKYQDNTLMVSKTYAPGQTIPAGTAVVVAAQPGSYPFLYSSETGDGDAANMLRGFDEAATAMAPEGNASDYYFYMLSLNKDSDPGSAGFYFGSGCTNGEPFTSGAHKAYLALPKSQANQARSFLLNAIPTGINKLTASPQQRGSSCVYNVAGQCVESNYHGIVIVNGKKRVVR